MRLIGMEILHYQVLYLKKGLSGYPVYFLTVKRPYMVVWTPSNNNNLFIHTIQVQSRRKK